MVILKAAPLTALYRGGVVGEGWGVVEAAAGGGLREGGRGVRRLAGGGGLRQASRLILMPVGLSLRFNASLWTKGLYCYQFANRV